MFEGKLSESEYKLWPYTFELYTILSFKVASKYVDVFNNLSRQVYNTIQALDLYQDPECKVVGEVKMDRPEFEDVTKPLIAIFNLLSTDGAFEADSEYLPSSDLMFEVMKLMTDSSTSLLWKVGHTDIMNEDRIDAIFLRRQKEIKSKTTANNSLNNVRNKFKHDVTKLYFENRAKWTNPNYASEQPDFQRACKRMAECLGFDDYERFDRYLRDTIYKTQKLIDRGEYIINDRYFSNAANT